MTVPLLASKTGFIYPGVHINYAVLDLSIPPCVDCGHRPDDYYTDPNRCAACHDRHCYELLLAIDRGEVWRGDDGVLRRRFEPLTEDDADYVGLMVDCEPGWTANLNVLGQGRLASKRDAYPETQRPVWTLVMRP